MKKIMSTITALVMLMGLASCNVNNGVLSQVRTVQKDSEWWNDSVKMVTPDEIAEKYEGMYDVLTACCAADEDSAVISFHIRIDDGKEDQTETLFRRYSFDGELLGEVSINDCLGNKSQNITLEDFFTIKDKYYALIQYYSEEAGNYNIKGYELDFEKGTLKESFPIDIRDKDNKFINVNDVTELNGKLVYIVSSFDLSFQAHYKICVKDGNKTREFDPKMGNGIIIESIYDLTNIDGQLVFMVNVTEKGQYKDLCCTLDADTFEMKILEINPKLIDKMTSYIPGKGFFGCDGTKLVKTDPVNGKSDVLVDTDNSYIGGIYVENMKVIYASDDKVVFFVDDQSRCGSYSTAVLVQLTRAAENPNAGKKILSLAKLDSMMEQEYYAVSDFNRNSDKYFIETDYKYYEIALEGWKIYAESESSDSGVILKYSADAVDVLCSDIREGKGPDLVIYNSEAAQLNSTDYLIDLTKRINSEKSLHSGDYMDFILQPNGRDGKHYRMDYGFGHNCFLVRNSLIDKGQKGLTFEQYDRLVSEANNGVSALYKGDLNLFDFMLNDADYMSYDNEGRFDIDTEGYRRLAKYIADIPDGMKYDEDYTGTISGIRLVPNMTFAECASFYSKIYKGYSMIGIPSVDGHAEVIKGTGIGITSCCPLQDGAWEFVMKMMSSEIQLLSFNDPVSITAQQVLFEGYCDLRNQLDHAMFGDGYHAPIDKDLAAWYIDQISDAVVVPDTDSSVIIIINEEMPAYFEGQKSLDDVIGIIENRVNLMLRERR